MLFKKKETKNKKIEKESLLQEKNGEDVNNFWESKNDTIKVSNEKIKDGEALISLSEEEIKNENAKEKNKGIFNFYGRIFKKNDKNKINNEITPIILDDKKNDLIEEIIEQKIDVVTENKIPLEDIVEDKKIDWIIPSPDDSLKIKSDEAKIPKVWMSSTKNESNITEYAKEEKSDVVTENKISLGDIIEDKKTDWIIPSPDDSLKIKTDEVKIPKVWISSTKNESKTTEDAKEEKSNVVTENKIPLGDIVEDKKTDWIIPSPDDSSKISINMMKKNGEKQEAKEALEKEVALEEIETEKAKNLLWISQKEQEEAEENKILFWNEKKDPKKRKEFDAKKVRDFHDAINAIKVYIFTEDWEKAHKAVEEIRRKEKSALNVFIQTIEDSDLKTSERKKFDENALIISKIEVKIKEKEQKYNDRISAEKFKIKFKKIKEEITLLSKTHKLQDAFSLLSNFLEDNKDKYVVIQFYNKEKKAIQKAIEKERLKEATNAKKNTKEEAMKLIWQTMTSDNSENQEGIEDGEKKEEVSKIKKFFSFYKVILEKKRRKKLIDEVTSLIESQNQAEMDIAKSKLEKVHQWLVKELSVTNIRGYEFFWKILWADKISWDTFGFIDDKIKYNFFLWDATGHWVKAWLIVSLLSRLFNKYTLWNSLRKMVFEINNWLKQDLQSRNFITWIFFEIEKEHPQIIKYIGMGHEPMFIYKSRESKVEKLVPWWLASWIRIIKQEEDLKVKDIELENNDILICFSDGIIEARNIDWLLYWMEKLEACIKQYGEWANITKLYNAIIDDVKIFKWWAKFDDDATIILLKRNESKDILQEKDNFLQEVATREGLSKNVIKKMVGKTKEQLEEEIEKIKKERQLLNIVKVLEWYYYTWEILMLKQEAIRFIKEWFIHPKINKYLKLAIANETKYKVEQKNKKIESKYNVLKELMKKWDYLTVIKECNEIIAKDGNI